MTKANIDFVEKAIAGDQAAFYQLMLMHKEQLFRMAFYMLRDEQGALEAIQETTYRAYKAIAGLHSAHYFKTWLIRILINYCHDQQKKATRERATEAQKIERLAEQNNLELKYSNLNEVANSIDLQQAIQLLEPHIQQVILLKYFEDLTIQEVADVLEHPVGTVKTWLHKGLKQLRIELAQEEGGIERYASF